MKRFALPVLGLIPLSGPALAAGPAGPISKEALHFRLEVGVEPGHFITGWLDESEGTGTGYDMVMLDLDADGTPDEEQAFGMIQRGDREMRDVKVRFEHEGAEWTFEPYSIGYRRPAVGKGVVTSSIRWSVMKEGRYCWFINSMVVLYTDPAKAAEAKPIRLGPPFRFDVTASTRGSDALVNVGLKDAQNGTLRLSRQGKDEVKPKIRLLTGDEVHVDVYARYG